MKKRALISVSNKTGIVKLANGLIDLQIEIVSTGGTAKKLEEAGVPVINVDDVTGFPEILDGRVKTLHPKIHGGLLAKHEAAHQEELHKHGIKQIDIVVANLYPFQDTIASQGVSEADVIENIDIGGSAMLRAAAKNFESVAVVVDPNDYDDLLEKLSQGKRVLDQTTRKNLATKVFQHTAQYDALIARYFSEQTEDLFPGQYSVTYEKVQTLRYGENPHQEAAFYQETNANITSITNARQLHGKELSYNNIQDANAALEMVTEYDQPAVVAVKHMNPCGIGIGTNLGAAFHKAYHSDPVSIFGGIIACNQPVDEVVARSMSDIFLEIILAPSFSEEALALLTKKKNIRLLQLPIQKTRSVAHELKSVQGGLLVQSSDAYEITEDELTYPTKQKPTKEQIADLIFAQKAVKHVKSNAIVLAKDGQTIGVGAGQMNRIGAAEIAIKQAREKVHGAVLASDAFFPMPDTVEAAANAGIKAIIQPGGSKRDEDSIQVCDNYGMAMVFTNVRHFKH